MSSTRSPSPRGAPRAPLPGLCFLSFESAPAATSPGTLEKRPPLHPQTAPPDRTRHPALGSENKSSGAAPTPRAGHGLRPDAALGEHPGRQPRPRPRSARAGPNPGAPGRLPPTARPPAPIPARERPHLVRSRRPPRRLGGPRLLFRAGSARAAGGEQRRARGAGVGASSVERGAGSAGHGGRKRRRRAKGGGGTPWRPAARKAAPPLPPALRTPWAPPRRPRDRLTSAADNGDRSPDVDPDAPRGLLGVVVLGGAVPVWAPARSGRLV